MIIKRYGFVDVVVNSNVMEFRREIPSKCRSIDADQFLKCSQNGVPFISGLIKTPKKQRGPGRVQLV